MILHKIIKPISVCAIVLSNSAWAEINMHEGLWETVTTTEIKGMPMQMPPVRHTQCMTKKELIPKGKHQMQKNCKVTHQGASGDTFTWEMVCTGEQNAVSHGQITYHGDTFEGQITTQMKHPQTGTMTMVNHLRGKYIGTCKK